MEGTQVGWNSTCTFPTRRFTINRTSPLPTVSRHTSTSMSLIFSPIQVYRYREAEYLISHYLPRSHFGAARHDENHRSRLGNKIPARKTLCGLCRGLRQVPESQHFMQSSCYMYAGPTRSWEYACKCTWKVSCKGQNIGKMWMLEFRSSAFMSTRSRPKFR